MGSICSSRNIGRLKRQYMSRILLMLERVEFLAPVIFREYQALRNVP